MASSGPESPPVGVSQIRPRAQVARAALVAVGVALLLARLASHTDVLFADGLRYVAQARAWDEGRARQGARSVDHPAYPLAVAAVHRLTGGDDGPDAWQSAAQVTSVVAAVLLVVPLCLVCRELFGAGLAAPCCALAFAVPMTGRVFADALSESTFLLFWTCGLWSALRFLRTGAGGWVAGVVAGSALAYLTRPEGLLLPAALLAAVALSPVWVWRGLRARRGLAVGAGLLAGSACLIGPFVALKGGLATKPSVARMLGAAPRSPAHAVERQRPLEAGQSDAKTYALAARAVGKAGAEAVTYPLLPFAAVGLWRLGMSGGLRRQARLLGVIGVASALALVRLYATGGYCTPRHALIPALIAIPAAASGLAAVLAWLADRAGVAPGGLTRSALWAGSAALLLLPGLGDEFAPLNAGLDGYRQAGRWVAGHAPGGTRIVDVTGWSQFYGRREGYTFEDLVAAPADPSARWVVAREAHLKGPWEYCRQLRALVDGLTPVAVFRGSAKDRPTKVYLYDRQPALAAGVGGDATRVGASARR